MTLGEYTEVYIDNSEPYGMEELFYDIEYTPIRKDLKPYHCDYMQGDAIIERKRVDDFLTSMRRRPTDKHSVWDQLNRMVNSDKHAYLIIEGDLWQYLPSSNMTTDHFYGAMGSIAVRYNIHPMWTHDLINFTYLVGKIFKSHREGKHGRGRDNKVTYIDPDISVAAQILSIPDGMDKMAVKIADQLGLNDYHDVGTLSLSELKTVHGIGEVKAKYILNYFNIPE